MSLVVIDHAAMRAALRGPVGKAHSVLFEMHVVMTCTSMSGVAEPELQLPYRAWYLAHYTRGELEIEITHIECNEGTAEDPRCMPDHLPNAAKRELEKLMRRALDEQSAIDATEVC